jgi:hypothetical protein
MRNFLAISLAFLSINSFASNYVPGDYVQCPDSVICTDITKCTPTGGHTPTEWSYSVYTFNTTLNLDYVDNQPGYVRPACHYKDPTGKAAYSVPVEHFVQTQNRFPENWDSNHHCKTTMPNSTQCIVDIIQ